MKKFKKVFAVLLTLAMVMGLGMTAFAEETGNKPATPVGTAADKGTLTVKGIESDNATVTAYPIVMAEYNNNGSFSGYSNPYKIADILAPTKDELDSIDVSNMTGVELTDGTDGTYTAENQAVGMYLIVVTKFDGATTYARAVASICYKNENGANVIDSKELTMATKVDAPATWVKKTTEVIVDKTAKVGNKDATSAKIGDVIDFAVEINPIPQYSGQYPVLNVVDTLSDGLTYQEKEGIVVTVDSNTLVEDEHYTVDYANGVLNVNFVVNGKYTLNDYAGKTAIISYKAELNENAVLNQGDGNTNDVTLNYTKDSTVDGDDDSDDDKTRTYTFEIDGFATGTTGILNKTGEKTEDKAGLDGAVFTIYKEDPTNNEKAEIYTNSSGTITEQGTVTTKTVDNKKGQLHISGLAEGTYYIRETSAPEGYSVNTHVFVVKIEAIWSEKDPTLCTGAKITVDGKAVATISTNSEGETVVDGTGTEILNTALQALPSTGGIGTTIFTIGGCAIMIIAAGLFFASRRKSAK